MEQKIKQDEIFIGQNIRRIRKEKGMRQTEMVALMQLENVPLTREALVKIERGIQHIQASQLRAIRNVLGTTYDEFEYSCAAEPPVQCGESHLSRLTGATNILFC